MLKLLSVHVTSVLFLVHFNNFALTMGFYWSYTLYTLVACSYALLVLHSQYPLGSTQVGACERCNIS